VGGEQQKRLGDHSHHTIDSLLNRRHAIVQKFHNNFAAAGRRLSIVKQDEVFVDIGEVGEYWRCGRSTEY